MTEQWRKCCSQVDDTVLVLVLFPDTTFTLQTIMNRSICSASSVRWQHSGKQAHSTCQLGTATWSARRMHMLQNTVVTSTGHSTQTAAFVIHGWNSSGYFQVGGRLLEWCWAGTALYVTDFPAARRLTRHRALRGAAGNDPLRTARQRQHAGAWYTNERCIYIEQMTNT